MSKISEEFDFWVHNFRLSNGGEHPTTYEAWVDSRKAALSSGEVVLRKDVEELAELINLRLDS